MRKKVLADEELVRAYVAGDERGFEVLLARHKRKVWAHIHVKVRDRAITEDIFQETFIKVVETVKAGGYREEGKFLPWVLRIAGNKVIDHFRRARKMRMSRSTDEQDVFARIPEVRENAQQRLVNAQIDADVRGLIEHLPEEQREVVVMRTYLSMSFKEIAEQTGVSINTALGRMRYALINMRKRINENDIQLDRE